MTPAYRFCWWCSRRLRGPFYRVVSLPTGEVKVHVECVHKVLKSEPSIGFVTCGAECPCRKPRRTPAKETP